MRTLYFLEPGQKLNDTKPSERKRALLMSKDEWVKLGDHLLRDQRRMEAAEKARDDLERRKMKSKEMAKAWDNTLMNIRRRRIENRRNQIAQLEKDRRKRFLEMRKEEADEKKRIVTEAQKILRRDKDNAKSLISALKFSEVLREREEQIKFEKKLQEIEAAREKIYADKLKADVEKYSLEIKEEKEQRLQKKSKLNKEVRQEMEEMMRKKREEEEFERKLEVQDNERTLEEMRTIENNERIELEKRKKLIMDDIIENRRLIAEYEAQCKREEEEEEAAIKIHAATKKRIAKIRQQREKEEALANQVKREKISASVAAVVADKQAEEDRMIRKAVAEREAKELEIEQKKSAHRKKLVEELKEARLRQLKLEEEEKYKNKELLKLNIMQRLKNTEVNEEFTKMMQERRKTDKKDNRKTWDQQCSEREATRAAERAEDVEAVRRAVRCWDLDDRQFLEYADEVIEESRRKNRPLLPMLKYIEQFKKEVGLTGRPKLHETWQSRVPINNQLTECPAASAVRANPWPTLRDRQLPPAAASGLQPV